MIGRPRFVVLAGINGAGKSTFAAGLLREPDMVGVPFVNADVAAAEAAAVHPELSASAAQFRGWRHVAETLDRLVAARCSVLSETVFANEAYIRRCIEAKAVGYFILIVFVGVPTVEHAIARVAMRVAEGGHNVSEADIRRRWVPTHTNLGRMVPLADEIRVFANPVDGREPIHVATALAGTVTLHDREALPAVTAVLAPLVRGA